MQANNEHTLGGETVLARHEKTFVSKNLYATSVCNANEDAANEAVLANIKQSIMTESAKECTSNSSMSITLKEKRRQIP